MVDVTATFAGHRGSCAGQTFIQTGAVVPHSMLLLDQGGDTPGASPMPLPPDCALSAVIAAAGGRIAAVVADTIGQGIEAQAGAYNAAALSDGALKTIVPLFRRRQSGLTTGIYAMNLGAAPSSAAISFYDSRDALIGPCGDPCRATIAPNATHRWWPGDIDVIPDGTFGHAVIDSEQPLTVVVSDQSLDGRFDLSLFGGVNLAAGCPGNPGCNVPIVLGEAGAGPGPSRTPPTPTLAATATPTPTSTPIPRHLIFLPGCFQK